MNRSTGLPGKWRNTMILTKEELRKLCRCECTVSELTGGNIRNLLIAEPYTMTLDDLREALKQYSLRTDRDELEDEWFWPVYHAYQAELVLLDESESEEFLILKHAWEDLHIYFSAGEGRPAYLPCL